MPALHPRSNHAALSSDKTLDFCLSNLRDHDLCVATSSARLAAHPVSSLAILVLLLHTHLGLARLPPRSLARGLNMWNMLCVLQLEIRMHARRPSFANLQACQVV